jgi:hypothetical protein
MAPKRFIGLLAVVALAAVGCDAAAGSATNTEIVDPRTSPPPPSNDAADDMMHNVDLGAPGQMYESNFTDANKCPACAAFALAVRRLNWDTPPREGAKDRRSGLINDERVSEIAFDALGAVVDHYVYVPSRQRYAPLVYARAATALTAAEEALAQKHVEVQGDQKLMDFIHFHLAEEAGDEAETIAGRDLLKGRLESDFAWPPNTGACDAAMGPECRERLSTFVLLKDKARDLQERVSFVKAVCKRTCGKRNVQTAIPLEHGDLGVPSVLQQAAADERAAAALEAEEELQREAKRFPPDSAEPAKADEPSEHQAVHDEAVHGRNDESKPPVEAEEREAADLAAHEEAKRVSRDQRRRQQQQAGKAVEDNDEGEF